MKVEFFKPFGPSIAKIKIPIEMVDAINEYTEEVINNEKKSKDLDWSNKLVGAVRQEFELEREFMEKIKWSNFLSNGVNAWLLNSHKKQITKSRFK